jgi:ATP-dependent Zn protease
MTTTGSNRLDNASRPRDSDRSVRVHLTLFDRSKFLLLFAIVFFVLVWAAMADNPLLSFSDAAQQISSQRWWIFLLVAVEVVRQVHFALSELLSPYHGIWVRYFAFVDRLIHRLSDWTRYRISRVIKAAIFVALLAVVLGAVYKETPVKALFLAPKALWSALPMLGQLAFAVVFIVIQFVAMFWFLSRGGIDTYFPDDIRTRFSDVWGQDHVLDRIRENLLFLEDPASIEEHGGYVPGGLLLWGPPGTGKTLMAESMAGESGKPFVFVDPGAFTNMFFGVGVMKVKSLFRKLRKLALRYGGVVVFFDEADSLGNRGIATTGGSRSTTHAGSSSIFDSTCHGGNYLSQSAGELLVRESFVANSAAGMGGGGMGTLQALLTELSGLKKPRGFFNRIVRRTLGLRPKNPPKYRILVVMATNMPEALDEALLRPGRIDRMYRVGYPSKAGRIRTYEGYLAKVSHSLTPEEIEKLSTITPYATGATIKDTINEALIMAIRNGRTTITWTDVIKAKQLKDLGPAEDVEYIERERHAVAVHEACHGVMAYLQRRHMAIDLATIEKGSDYLGMVASIPPDDQFTHWRTEYEADILVSLASLAGERYFFDGDNSSGVSGDLESATTIASFMEGHWGMGSTVSSHASNRRFEVGAPGGGKPRDAKDGSAELRRALADRIEDNLSKLLVKAEEILAENRLKVLALAHALETHKTISGEDVTAVMTGGVGPLVDGRPYGDSANLLEIEKYHVAALAAHKSHQRPDVRIPVFHVK